MSLKKHNITRNAAAFLMTAALSAGLLTGCSGTQETTESVEQNLTISSETSDVSETSESVNETISSIFETHSETDDWVTETPAEGLSGFYYDQLSESVQNVYAQMYSGITAKKTEFYIDCHSTNEIGVALRAMLDDHPELFWVDGSVSIYGSEEGGKERITPSYNIDLDSIDAVQAQIDAEYEAFLAVIPTNATAYQIVKTAYQFVIDQTDYDADSTQNQNIQSVFLNHRSVCAGYAKAFQYLLTRTEIPCYYVHGTISDTGATHAWNLVLIDGTPTWVDPTWGDPTYGENADDSAQMDIIYDYLCITDSELERTGHVADTDFSYPEVTDTSFDYYRLLKDYLEGYDPKVIKQHLMATVNSKTDRITFLKFDTFESYAQAVNGLFEEGDLLEDALQAQMKKDGTSSIQYYYSKSDEMLTIKIFW